jgi:ubiquinone/menaquinone biosynthesis C-methylase UbiE
MDSCVFTMITASTIWLFNLGAGWYNLLTANPVWQASCSRLLEDVPDGAECLRVLDLGVGPGVSAMMMARQRPGAGFIGLDFSPCMLAEAQINRLRAGWPPERLALLQADALRLPLADRQADVVTGHSFLYLLPDYRSVLAEVVRVLRPGGRAAFLEPHAGRAGWGWLVQQGSLRLLTSLAAWRGYSRLHRRFAPENFCHVLEGVGLANVTTEVTLGGFGILVRAQKPART